MKNLSILLLSISLCLTSCDKGYEVRFTNYYIEPMDSVTIGENKVVFTDIDLQQTTGYSKISKGKYPVRLVSRNKSRFSSELEIPASGSGKFTIQIDGIRQISVLPD